MGNFWHAVNRAPRHGFRFKNKLYALDASLIELCLEVFPWARYRTTKGAIKLHVGLDHSGHLPAFVAVTEGKTHEITWARTLELPASSMVVFDRGFTDYAWYHQLHEKRISFVTRQKTNARYTVTERRSAAGQPELTSDQTIRLTGVKAQHCPIALRRIGYRDPDTGKHYVFLTNNFRLAARTIAEIYKQRWQIELFFKWIKQNLKIKRFLGTSKNAVLTQLWIALCVYLLLAYLKFISTLGHSLQQSLRLLQLNLFERRALLPLLRGDPPDTLRVGNRAQLALL